MRWVSQRQVYLIWARHKKTGTITKYKRAGRPRAEPTRSEARLTDMYSKFPAGPVHMVKKIRAGGSKISYYKAYRIMKREMVDRTKSKSKRRKWVRYERMYSNAMWHVDWHMIKGDSRLGGMWLIAYLDDASRCVTGYGVFENVTTANSILSSRVQSSGLESQLRGRDTRLFSDLVHLTHSYDSTIRMDFSQTHPVRYCSCHHNPCYHVRQVYDCARDCMNEPDC